jgi:hypothetical protein
MTAHNLAHEHEPMPDRRDDEQRAGAQFHMGQYATAEDLANRAGDVRAALGAWRLSDGDAAVVPASQANHVTGTFAEMAGGDEHAGGSLIDASSRGRRSGGRHASEAVVDTHVEDLSAAAKKHAIAALIGNAVGRHAGTKKELDPERDAAVARYSGMAAETSRRPSIADALGLRRRGQGGAESDLRLGRHERRSQERGSEEASYPILLDRSRNAFVSEGDSEKRFGIRAALIGLIRGRTKDGVSVRAGMFVSHDESGPTVTLRNLDRDRDGQWKLARDSSGENLAPAVTVRSGAENAVVSLEPITGDPEDTAVMEMGRWDFSRGELTSVDNPARASVLVAKLPSNLDLNLR